MTKLTVDEFEIYKHLRDFESDFNSLQAGIHKLASGWLLASLGGIIYSFTVKIEGVGFPVNASLLSSISACLGSIGMFTLWVLGQQVYQNLLNAAFMEGLKLEINNPDLPQVRKMMWYNSANAGMSKRMKLFYVLPIIVLGGIGIAISWLTLDSTKMVEFYFKIALGLLSFGFAYYISQEKGRYRQIIEEIGDKKMTEWYEQVTKK